MENNMFLSMEDNKFTEVIDPDNKPFKYVVGGAAIIGAGCAIAALCKAGKNGRLIRQADSHNESNFSEVRGLLGDISTEVAYGSAGVPVIVRNGHITPVDTNAVRANYNLSLSNLMNPPAQAPQFQPMCYQPPQPVQAAVQQMPAPQYAPAPVKQDPQEAATAAIMGNPALMQQIIAGVVNAMTPPASAAPDASTEAPASTNNTKKK